MDEGKKQNKIEVLPHDATTDKLDLQVIYKMVEEMMSVNALAEYNSDEQKKKADKEYRQMLLWVIEIADMMDKYFRDADVKKGKLNPETLKWLNYFKGIRRKIERDLTLLGVVPIEAPDGQAVPGFHTVIDTCHAEGIEAGTIMQERKKGYLFQKSVLRKAEVVTAE